MVKESLAKWTEAVHQRDAELTKSRAEIEMLTHDRNSAVKQFNDLAEKYNRVVQDLNKRTEDFNSLVERYNKLAQTASKCRALNHHLVERQSGFTTDDN
ncbi:MAG: hypothetical protein ACXW3L_08405 [Limisphaerales bacterium]